MEMQGHPPNPEGIECPEAPARLPQHLLLQPEAKMTSFQHVGRMPQGDLGPREFSWRASWRKCP